MQSTVITRCFLRKHFIKKIKLIRSLRFATFSVKILLGIILSDSLSTKIGPLEVLVNSELSV